MASFRFFHAADIHLDSPLAGLAGLDERVARRVRTATRDAFDALIGRAIEAEAAFLIVAGDLYDGDWRDYHTGLFFAGQMGRLKQAGIPVFLVHGNHDAESQITRRLALPDTVTVFPTRKAATALLPALDVAVHGQGFGTRDVSDNLVPGYPEPRAGMFNIGVLHTGLGGLGGHANYAPCALSDLIAKGYQYWALGHVHQRTILCEHPPVVFPGNLQGRHANETGAKGASLVDVEDGRVADVAAIALDAVRWARLEIDVAECDHADAVLDRIGAALEAAVAREAGGRMLLCRLTLTGRTPAHGALVTRPEDILAGARSMALGLGEDAAWIERVIDETAPPGTGLGAGALESLRQVLGEAGADDALLAQLEEDPGLMARRLPAVLRGTTEDPVLRALLGGDTVALVARVAEDLVARLAVED